MKKGLFITKRIFCGALFVTVLVALPLIVFTLLTSKVNIFGIQSFVVLTGSMSPALPPGSVVFTQTRPSYNVGDVISFASEGVTITHRVVEITPDGYVTRGDANNTTDPDTVATSAIVGVSVFSLPHVGNFVLFLRTTPGFVLFVIVPGLLFIFFELWNIKNHIVDHTRKKVIEEMSIA